MNGKGDKMIILAEAVPVEYAQDAITCIVLAIIVTFITLILNNWKHTK